MWIYILIIVWILATYPITKAVNERMEERDDDARFFVSFQLLLFIRAVFHVPKYYFNLIRGILNKR